MRTMDKLTAENQDSFVWTLLSGRALEVVEHLKPEEYQVKDGEKAIFKLLDKVWPEKEWSNELSENISLVFNLKAKEGESMRQGCARARETFDRCSRKSGVDFPLEARGYILLNASGMTD